MSLKILHAADFHLDSPFEALGADSGDRRADQRLLLSRMVDIAEERQADLILLAGDLLDSAFCYRETLDAIRDAFGRAPCPVLISPGNHDRLSPTSPYRKEAFPENVHIFRSPTLTPLSFPDLGVTVYGAGYLDETCGPLLHGFTAPPSGEVKIGLLHSNPLHPGTKYCPISEEDIASSGLDYLALGHVHSFDGLHRSGATFWASPGCPEGRGFDETGDKGVLFLEVGKGTCSCEFIPTAATRYRILKVDISEAALGGRSVEDLVLSALPEGTERDICRLVLAGSADRAPNLFLLQHLLEKRFRSLQVLDETVPAPDIWQEAGESTLKGLFLRRMHEKYAAAPDDAARRQVTLALRWGLAALEGREPVTKP